MLAINLPIMKENLNLLLTPSKGNPFYDAAYDAYYEASKAEAVSYSPDDDPCGNQRSESVEIAEKINEAVEICADKFAKSFCDSLKKGKFMDCLADEVDNHIKSMKLMINMPTLLHTIISPAGPCTGSLMINDATAQIQIR